VLQTRQNHLLNEVDRLSGNKVTLLTDQLKQLQGAFSSVSNGIEQTEQTLQFSNDTRLILIKQLLEANMNNWNSLPCDPQTADDLVFDPDMNLLKSIETACRVSAPSNPPGSG